MALLPHEAKLFETLLAQHQTLKELLNQIGAALEQRTASISEVGDLLARLGDLLVKHFALEEAEGYLGEALMHAPRLVRRANDLLAQHPKMTTQAQQLLQIEKVGADRQQWWDITEQRFQDFLKEMLQHERSEDRLLQEAYSRDIQAGD
jgi:hypothetical protein